MIKKTLVRVLYTLVLLVAILPAASAAQLGVNYYDETLMNANTHGKPFIQRSIEGVGQDFDNIKTISNNVKLYMDPFVNENLPWVLQVTDVAKGKGMHVVVNMMVDFPQLDNSNWDDYSNRVVNACAALNGKADEVLVGNEITLHSPMGRTEIRDKVIDLMDRCDAVFDGDVSYEEFWYANEVWRGTGRRVYFMMYENIDSFRGNMQELQSNFGSNGYIGEWGEDLLEDDKVYDDQWQKDQIRQRWDIIQQSPVPVAYIFTYREPSYTSFSMLRPEDDSRRPLWEVFGAPTSTPVPVPQPLVEQPEQPEQPVQPEQPPVEQPVEQPVESPVEQPVDSSVQQPESPVVEQPQPVEQPVEQVEQVQLNPTLKTEMVEGACTVGIYGTSADDIVVLSCPKPEGDTELYVLESPQGAFEICINGGCVSDENGYARFVSSNPSSPASSVTGFVIDGITATSDEFDGACRTVGFDGGSIKICDKGGSYEMWLYGSAEACVDGNCVGAPTSYVSW